MHNGRHDDDGGHGRPASNHRDGDNETKSESVDSGSGRWSDCDCKPECKADNY